MKIVIISLKFSIGHLSHLIAYYKMILESGYRPCFFIDKQYLKFIKEKNDYLFYNSYSQLLNDFKPDIAIFYSPALENGNFLKKFKKIKTIYIFHEPYIGIREALKEGKKFLKYLTTQIFQLSFINKVNYIILCSEYALACYKKYYYLFNKNCSVFPLIFEDEDNLPETQRINFSYIGAATVSHGIKEYIEFVIFCYKKNIPIKFSIITRHELSGLLNNEIIKKVIEKGNLYIKSGSPLTTDEINDAYKKSICVWGCYNRSTQSGVVRKALMFGTPVIAVKKGSFSECIKDRETGILVKDNRDFKEIYDGYSFILKNIKSMSRMARQDFLRNYFYKEKINEFKMIVAEIENLNKR